MNFKSENQKNMETGGRLQAYRATPEGQKAARKVAQEHGGHSLFSLHTLEDALGKTYGSGNVVKRGTAEAVPLEKAEREGKPLPSPPGLAMAQPKLSGGLVTNVGGTVKAFANHPIGTTEKTASSLPNIASSLIGMGLRGGEETGLGAAKALPGNPLHIPRNEGEPLTTAKEFAKGAVQSTAHLLGENMKESQDEAEKEGAAAKILTFAPAVGGALALGGRLLTKGVAEGGVGAAEFAARQSARDAAMAAVKNGTISDYVAGGSKLGNLKANLYEAATQPRPNLRTAPGNEAVKVEPGAAVRPQVRSPNLFRALPQTLLDSARHNYTLKGLQKVADERKAFLESYPHMEGHNVPVTYAQHLATAVHPGEVTPLFQKGGVLGSDLLGAGKAQRMGASYPGNDVRRAGQTARTTVAHEVHDAVKALTPDQQKLLVLAKEGHFPLHDPVKAQAWLEEVSRQAKAGSTGADGRTIIPWAHRQTGSDVARQVDSVVANMKKNGPESVITPEFKSLVERVPDERLVSPKDPLLQQIPDEVAARKYLPQQQTLDAWAQHELSKTNPHPDARSTATAIVQMHDKLHAGKDLRAAAKTADAGQTAGIDKLGSEPEAQRLIAANKAVADHKAMVAQGKPIQVPVKHEPDLSYQAAIHRPPGVSEGTRLSDMSAAEQAVHGVDSRGMVTIHRSAPAREINKGDWVSTDRASVSMASGNPVTSHQVPASDLVRRSKDDPHEFAYIGPHHTDTPTMRPLAAGEAKAALQSAKDEQKLAAKSLKNLATDPTELHARADNHFADAKNLADENANRHGLPTDRAYIQHQRTRGRESFLHTIGRRTPPDPKKWGSVLQRQGYRSTDPALVEDGMLKSIRNKLAVEHISKFDERFRVPGTANKLTSREAHAELLKKGLNPDHYEVANLGKIFQGISEHSIGGADMLHLDLNPLDHSKTLGDMVHSARGLNPNDVTKGFQIYPKTALNELQGNLSSQKLALRAYGKVKGKLSSLMLGTNPGWATNMSAVTYPSQFILGGGHPWDFPASVKWYKGLSEGDKRTFDLQTGTDNPFKSSHEMNTEKLGASAKGLQNKPKIDTLLNNMQVMRRSPVGRFLSTPEKASNLVLKLERVPRRYARIGVAAKHMKNMAIDKMLEEAKGLHAAQGSLEKATLHLKTLGRMPADKYMNEVAKSIPHMEEVAAKTSSMLGEWQHMTNLERNTIGKVPLFYPWIRYSLNLATKTLPRDHPLGYALAGQLGVMSREEMRRLLGTDTPVGKAPLGRAQPGLEPNERQWDWAGASQADPLLNQFTDLLNALPGGTGSAADVLGTLPPFISAPIEYMANRNFFTDKPLKNAEPYKFGQHKENRPGFFGTMAAKAIETLDPGRAAQEIASGGRPQAADSLFGSKPMSYSPRAERSIEEGAKEKTAPSRLVGKFGIPLFPHKEPGILESKFKQQAKEKKKEEQTAGNVSGW
jgi:hypothetical protein